MTAPTTTPATEFSVGIAPRTNTATIWSPGATAPHYLTPADARALAALLVEAAKSAEYLTERAAERAR